MIEFEMLKSSCLTVYFNNNNNKDVVAWPYTIACVKPKWQRGWPNWEPYTDFRTLTNPNPDAQSYLTVVRKLQFNHIPNPNLKLNPLNWRKP